VTWSELPCPPLVAPSAEPQPGRVPVVWPIGARREDLAGHGYDPDTVRDHLRIHPRIAAYAISAYARPGGMVLDPDCGAGTVLVEALRAGRHAVGLTRERRWWTLARANLSVAKREGATADGMVLDRPLAARPPNHTTALNGAVDLVLTAWRHPHLHGPDPVRSTSGQDRLGALLAWCRPLLRPGGHVVVIARPQRRRGYLLDGPGQVMAAARTAQLVPLARHVALLADLRNGCVHVAASTAQQAALARHQRTTRQPIASSVHHEVLVFHAPLAAAQAAAVCAPAAGPIPSRLLARADVGVRELVGGAA
jgi:modification methylase